MLVCKRALKQSVKTGGTAVLDYRPEEQFFAVLRVFVFYGALPNKIC
jgi:hypothetical protein